MQREAATARFRPGDRVRVRAAHPPGHIRTPYYCRGHVGVVERLCGAFANPEELAYNRPGRSSATSTPTINGSSASTRS